MNYLRINMKHEAFETYAFNPIDFKYQNINIELKTEKTIVLLTLISRKKANKIYSVFYKIFDWLFLVLGGFPIIERVTFNDEEVNIDNWVRKFETASHYILREARLCEITKESINEEILDRMSNVHQKTLYSLEYIICDYYSHMITNHKVELITHTIDGFFRHTKFSEQLLNEIQLQQPKKHKVDYINCVERVFKLFFYYHRKYNCQLLNCMHVKSKHRFCEIIADTRNDFTHFLDSKVYRMLFGKEMLYYIDLILYALRLFLLAEVLEITLDENLIKEYMYIQHDWIDELVNGRKDRLKSQRYKKIAEFKQMEILLNGGED